MMRFLLFTFFLTCSFIAFSQADFIVLKKKDRSIQQFREDGYIVFQPKGGSWIAGKIMRIANDSFFVQPYVVHYSMMGVDTARFFTIAFSINDVAVVPRKSAMVVFRNERPEIISGHEKWVWVKNGLLFQVVGGGYALLNIANSLGSNDPPFAKKNLTGLGIAAGVFLFGEILHLTYKKYLYLGEKYKLVYVHIDK